MRRRNFLRLGSGEAIGGALAACAADAAPIAQPPAPRPERRAGIVRAWNALALRAIRDTQSGLPLATRTLAILHTCMYNAWAAYDDAARQTVHGRAVRLPRAERSAASRASAMSHAACLVLCERFPSHAAGFDAHLAGLGLVPSRLDRQFTPAGIGRTQAIAMLDACRQDEADAPGEPAAGLPFALVSPSQLRPTQPAPHAAADRPRETEAEAGADAELPHAWCRLAQQLSERDGYDDDRDVLLYFVLANALADAAPLAGRGALDAAAAGVLRSFTGSAEWRAGSQLAAGDVDDLELGRRVGALVFEKARRYWQGKL